MIRWVGLQAARVAALAGVTAGTAAALWPVSWGLDRIVEAYAGTPAPRLWQHWAAALAAASPDEVTIGVLNAVAAVLLVLAAVALVDRVRARLSRRTVTL